jgi:hypothetical protein
MIAELKEGAINSSRELKPSVLTNDLEINDNKRTKNEDEGYNHGKIYGF